MLWARIDIIPRRQLASAFAWNVAMVFTSGNMIGPMFVGFMAQNVFHYKLSNSVASGLTNTEGGR